MAKIILVVDDELSALRRIHVEGVVGNFYETLADTTDPLFEELWNIAKSIPSVSPLVDDELSAAAYFSSDNAVKDLLLSPEFAAAESPKLKELLATFLARAERVESLRAEFLTAFPSDEFVVEFIGAPRPPVERVVQCAAVFLDLFLEDGAADAVDAVQNYLRWLVEQAGDALLPPLVLMSLHSELSERKRYFSEHARISAAGLMILPKEKIAEAQFGAVGLRLSFDQLTRQSAVAHSMRLFISSWIRAQQRAAEETSKTLWNLDASAMQQIHLASVSDDDPYDEHLNELLSREHLYRVEADMDVGAKIQGLDLQFRAHLTLDGQDIANRLIAPLTDVNTSRSLMSHFTWLGSRPARSFLDGDEECAANISRSLPFGSVVCGPTLSDGSQCLVHVTQQCDLNGISRSKNITGTVMFAIAEARELQLSDNPINSTSDLVARSLRFDENGIRREFDLRVLVGEVIAMPLQEFIQRWRREEFRIIGRLRSDITNHIVAATSNHMSRPASQKMLRPAMLRAKIFLQSKQLKNGKTALTEGTSARIFSLTRERDLYSFQDDACVEIALWLVLQVSHLGIRLEVDSLCTSLRRGWRTDKNLGGEIMVKVREWERLDQAFKALIASDVDDGKTQLTIVVER